MFSSALCRRLRVRIYSIEPIGDHTLVTVKVGEQDVAVKVSNTLSGEMGGAIGLTLSPERAFLFRAQSGERIRL